MEREAVVYRVEQREQEGASETDVIGRRTHTVNDPSTQTSVSISLCSKTDGTSQESEGRAAFVFRTPAGESQSLQDVKDKKKQKKPKTYHLSLTSVWLCHGLRAFWDTAGRFFFFFFFFILCLCLISEV